MKEGIDTEFWIPNSENVSFRRGWMYHAVEFQQFMKKLEEDSRGGKIIGMNFDGKNVEFYTETSAEQMKEYLENNNANQ